MQKKFLSNLLLIVLLNLLIKPLAIFGIDAGVQNRLGTETYGLYFSLLNMSFLFNIIGDMGINNFTTRTTARYPRVMPKYIGQILGIRFILFLVYFALTVSVGLLVGYRGEAIYFLMILILNQLLATMIAFLRSHFGGLHLFRTDAIISVLDRLILILLCGSMLYLPFLSGYFSMVWFIWIQTISYGVTLLISSLLLFRKIGIPRIRIKKAIIVSVLRQSMPYALLILLMTIYTKSDSVLLERLHPNGAFEAGIYAKGFRLLDAFYMFGMIFANLLLPLFARALKEQKDKVLPLLRMGSQLLLGGAILIAFLCFFHSKEILSWIYHEDIELSSGPFQLMMIAFSGMCASMIFGSLLTANGELKFLNMISLVGVLLNISLNVIFIPIYGALGAAMVCLITQLLMAAAQMILCIKRFKFSFADLGFHKYFLLITWLIAGTFLSERYYFSLPILLLIGISGLFLFKLIDLKNILLVFRENS